MTWEAVIVSGLGFVIREDADFLSACIAMLAETQKMFLADTMINLLSLDIISMKCELKK
jgi:hypothetical protein